MENQAPGADPGVDLDGGAAMTPYLFTRWRAGVVSSNPGDRILV